MTHDTPTPLLLRIGDACRYAGIGRTRMFGLIGSGQVEARKAGARTLVVTESLRRWAAGLPPAGPARPDTPDAA